MACQVKVEITRFVDDNYPGWVECRLVDAWQQEWLFIEKAPVVTLEHLDSESTYPLTGYIFCFIVGTKYVANLEIITIDTSEPLHINAVDGETQFEVLAEQVNFEGITFPE